VPDNIYSATWFETFLRTIPAEQTRVECDFVERQLPRPAFSKLLDVCCGMGRHAIPLAERGYRVTGVDVDAQALAAAGVEGQGRGQLEWVQGDMRDLAALPDGFDGALLLWQSFGQFDAATNEDVLRQIVSHLRPGGRFILDIYHREFFAAHLEEQRYEQHGRTITGTRRMEGHRLTVTLDYGPDLPRDEYSWELYTPDEIAEMARRVGLELAVCCVWFDEARPAAADVARLQCVFARA
jgi:SAM-dependent methyltransferase